MIPLYQLQKLSDLTAILVSMYELDANDIKEVATGTGIINHKQFVRITMCQGVVIILPDVNVHGERYIFYDTNEKSGYEKMINQLIGKGYEPLEVSQFLDTPFNKIQKIMNKGGNK